MTARWQNRVALAIDMPPDDLNKHRIEVILSRLRQRATRLTGQTLPLRSVRGLGYRFHLSDED